MSAVEDKLLKLARRFLKETYDPEMVIEFAMVEGTRKGTLTELHAYLVIMFMQFLMEQDVDLFPFSANSPEVVELMTRAAKWKLREGDGDPETERMMRWLIGRKGAATLEDVEPEE